jgi:hypothetical protein
MTRVRAAIVALGLTVAAGGCGGDDGPSAGERRAAMARWVAAADEACSKAEAAIARRGEPLDLRDVDRVVVRAAADVRRAAATIRRLPMPPGGAAKVRPVLAAMDKLEGPLQDIVEWSEVAKADELVKAAEAWRSQSYELARRAYEAGLRVCGRHGARWAVADGIVAPVFRTQLAEFQEVLLAELRSVRSEAKVTDRASAAEYLQRFSEHLAGAAARYSGLEPPLRAEEQSSDYFEILDRASVEVWQWSRETRRRAFTPAFARTLERRFLRLGRQERRAARALAKALQPAPAREPPTDSDRSVSS